MRPKTLIITKEGGTITSDYPIKDTIESLPNGVFLTKFILLADVASPQQFGWYWVICGYLAKNTDHGMSKEDWHEFFSAELLSEEKQYPLPHMVKRSTTDLLKDEFIDYLTKILIFCETEETIGIPKKFLLPRLPGYNNEFNF